MQHKNTILVYKTPIFSYLHKCGLKTKSLLSKKHVRFYLLQQVLEIESLHFANKNHRLSRWLFYINYIYN